MGTKTVDTIRCVLNCTLKYAKEIAVKLDNENRQQRVPKLLEIRHGIVVTILWKCGPGSSVSIVTDYGLDGPGSNPGVDEIFRPPRPALGPTQPPVKWVPVLSRG